MHTDKRTLAEWAQHTGKDIASVLKQARRKRGQSARTDILTLSEWSELYPDKNTDKTNGQVAQTKQTLSAQRVSVRHSDVSASQAAPKGAVVRNDVPPPPLSKPTNLRRWILYCLMAIPALASIQNIHGVTLDITGHLFGSVLLTGLFSAAPFLFVLAGVKNAATRILVALMVIYEAFCNLTRIYGGLTGFGKGSFPTRFLGLVTDIFNTGTHQTAIVLAVVMSIIAACTFYAAFFELGKSK